MLGLHLTADLHGCHCDPQWLTDADQLLSWCLQAVRTAGLQPVNHVAHAFPATALAPGGVTATVLLAESHLCLHTWPERQAVTADIYVCNFGADHSHRARALMAAVVRRFQPQDAVQRALQRGVAMMAGTTGREQTWA